MLLPFFNALSFSSTIWTYQAWIYHFCWKDTFCLSYFFICFPSWWQPNGGSFVKLLWWFTFHKHTIEAFSFTLPSFAWSFWFISVYTHSVFLFFTIRLGFRCTIPCTFHVYSWSLMARDECSKLNNKSSFTPKWKSSFSFVSFYTNLCITIL